MKLYYKLDLLDRKIKLASPSRKLNSSNVKMSLLYFAMISLFHLEKGMTLYLNVLRMLYVNFG